MPQLQESQLQEKSAGKQEEISSPAPRSYDLSRIEFFPFEPKELSYSESRLKQAQDFTELLNKRYESGQSSILGTLIELGNLYTKAGDTEAANLVRQMTSHLITTDGKPYPRISFTGAVNPSWNSRITVSPFFIAQRKLAQSRGVLVNPLTKWRPDMHALLMPVDKALEYTSCSGQKYPIFLHATDANNLAFGSTHGGILATVNTKTCSHNVLNENGRLNALLANELAHLFLTQELGFQPGQFHIPGGAISVSVPRELLDEKAAQDLSQIQVNNGNQVHDTVSDFFSTRVDAKHEMQRLAAVYINIKSLVAARSELGLPNLTMNYGLSANLAGAIIESHYRNEGKADELQFKIDQCRTFQLALLKKETAGESFQQERQDLDEVIRVFGDEIAAEMGTKGESNLQKMFAHYGETIISTLEQRQGMQLVRKVTLPAVEQASRIDR